MFNFNVKNVKKFMTTCTSGEKIPKSNGRAENLEELKKDSTKPAVNPNGKPQIWGYNKTTPDYWFDGEGSEMHTRTTRTNVSPKLRKWLRNT